MDSNFWTEDPKFPPINGYFNVHIEKQCYVLEPTTDEYAQIKVSDNETEFPLILIHGINGDAEYWEEDTKIPNALRSEDILLWEFYYRGQDSIPDCAFMLRNAIHKVSEINSQICESCDKVDLVTHSFGGVITRFYLGQPLDRYPIRRLLMVGPPHRGSYSAYRIFRADLVDSIAILQRMGLFESNKYLDPKAPIYRELTPGSLNLLLMEEFGQDSFPGTERTLVLAGIEPLFPVTGIHDEAPNHDDGVVSISSASLLDHNVNLGIIELNNDQQRKNSTIVNIIKDYFTGNGDVPVGEEHEVKTIIHAGREPPYSYPDPDTFLWRGGLIVETSLDVDSIELVHPSTNDVGNPVLLPFDYRKKLERVLVDYRNEGVQTYCFYDNEELFRVVKFPDTSDSTPETILYITLAGLPYPFENGREQIVTLEYTYNNDGIKKYRQISLDPCKTKIVRLEDESFDESESDGDGLFDILEVTIGTDPFDADTDDDGLVDGNIGSEDLNVNGIVDPGETDPLNPETDGDGILDGTERSVTEPETEDTDVSAGYFVPDADPSTTTDPTDADSDDDGIIDGNEDKNHDAMTDMSAGETDPNNPDTDGDGLPDGLERGLIEPETEDTDVSVGFFIPDADPSTTTDPMNPDSDGDGISDGDEDLNRDGAFDPDQGETDPNTAGIPGDLAGDGDVDRDDVNIIKALRNQPASVCPECDIDGDGTITVLDARKLMLMCTCPRCICE